MISLKLGRSEDAGYVASPRATIGIWTAELDRLHLEPNEKRLSIELWGPAVWVPWPEEALRARVMTITDSFGNSFPVHGADSLPADTPLVGTT